MRLKTILLGAAACAWLGAPASAQTATDAQPKKHHHHAASGVEDRLNRMERLIEEQAAEIRDLKAKVGEANASGGATTAAAPTQPAPQPEVSAAEFQALQNQVYEQAAENKGQASVTIKKGRPTIAT